MNYAESQPIADAIRAANAILISCHNTPDGDSVGSSIALAHYAQSLGKDVQVVCVDEIPAQLKFLLNGIHVEVCSFVDFDYSPYDLYIVPDSSTWEMVCGTKDIALPPLENIIVIDHHQTNNWNVRLKLLDAQASSVCEIITLLFEDIHYQVSPGIATALLTGIITDTGCYRFDNTNARTLTVAGLLQSNGAVQQDVVFNTFQSRPFMGYKYYAVILNNAKIDNEYKFVWTAISYEENKIFDEEAKASRLASDMLQGVTGTKLGIKIEEEEPGAITVSIRARENIDISVLAKSLGGGGHKKAAGAMIRGMEFDDAVALVLKTTRSFLS